MAESVQCKFSRGCMLRTRDASGLCHNHRRFSALSWNHNGEMTQPRRLSNTVKMLQTSPEYMETYKRASEAIDFRVTVSAEDTNGSFFLNNTRGYEQYKSDHPISWVNRADGNLGFFVNGEMNDQERAAIALDVRDEVRQTQYADRFWLGYIAEEYDDEAEVIAQLKIAQRNGVHGQLSIMRGGDDMYIFLTPNDQNAHPQLTAKFLIMSDRINETSPGLARMYIPIAVDGVENERNQEILNQVMHVTATIDELGVRTKEGRILMPVGWSDR